MRTSAFCTAVLVAICFLPSCRGKGCTIQLQSTPSGGGALTVGQNSSISFSTTAHPCDSRDSVTYRWSLNGDTVSLDPSYTYWACHATAGTPDTVIVTAIGSRGETARAQWSITVSPAPMPAPPAAVGDAITTVKNGGHFGVWTTYVREITATTAQNEASFTAAVQALEPYVRTNACDLDATYAYALAKTVLLDAQVQDLIVNHANLSTTYLQTLYDTSAAPIAENMIILKEEADDSFLFPILQPLRVGVVTNLPQNALGISEVTLNFSGYHGRPEIFMLTTISQALAGLLNTVLAFRDIPEFAANPSLTLDIDHDENLFIQALEADPGFLTLAGDAGADGQARLRAAQASFATALRTFTQTIDIIMGEPSPDFQYHIFRFWDCGPDGVCPAQTTSENNALANQLAPSGDTCEPYFTNSTWISGAACENQTTPYQKGDPFTDTNHSGNWNNSWTVLHTQGTEPDAGEGNGLFDSGEPLGTEMVMELGLRGIALPVGYGVRQALALIAENIEGPGPLDLDAVAGYLIPLPGSPPGPFPPGTVRNFLTAFRIPYPEVALSDFFDAPAVLRNLVPLYDRTALAVIVQSEEEYCQSPGQPPRVSYLINGCPNDIGVPGSNTSDWSPFSNPNSTRKNYQYDPGEPFSDTGVWDGKEIVPGTAGNGREDSLDIDHYWPTGSTVGGPPATVSVDFQDSTAADMSTNPPSPCIEELYLFFPDPTFAGVLTFPDAVTNVNNLPLDDNGKFHRFVAMALQTVKRIGSYGLPSLP